MSKTFLVTGGAGFIGSHLVKTLLERGFKVICLDLLTYAGNPENLRPFINDGAILFPTDGESLDWMPQKIEEDDIILGPKKLPLPQLKKLVDFRFERVKVDNLKEKIRSNLKEKNLVLVVGSVADKRITKILTSLCDGIFHLAAETHVDRSILNPETFLKTDILGTYVMLEAFRQSGNEKRRFLHVSTDEVYGEILHGKVDEGAPLNPRNPYSASKAAADRLAYSYYVTYGLDIVIARPSNNYGPFQFPEKLIPFMIMRALENQSLPLYGNGQQVRDWSYVEDTAEALIFIYERGKRGEIYNIAGHNERKNIDVVKSILSHLRKGEEIIQFVKDRPGHDRRYALDDRKLRKTLGFEKTTPFEKGLKKTVNWYLENRDWLKKIIARNRETEEYFKKWYKERGFWEIPP